MPGVTRDESWVRWAVVLLVAVGAGAIAPRALARGRTPVEILIRVSMALAPLAMVPIVYRIWPPRGGERFSTKRWVTWLAVLGVAQYALLFFQPWYFSLLGRHPRLEEAVGGLVNAGNGELLALLMLVVFVGLILLRRPRAS